MILETEVVPIDRRRREVEDPILLVKNNDLLERKFLGKSGESQYAAIDIPQQLGELGQRLNLVPSPQGLTLTSSGSVHVIAVVHAILVLLQIRVLLVAQNPIPSLRASLAVVASSQSLSPESG